MANVQPVSQERHGSKLWQRNKNYLFAANDAVCPLVLTEIPKAALSLPLAFAEIENTYTPIAVLGLVPGKNSFVSSTGLWMGEYLPSAYRCFPFSIAKQDDQRFLCVDEEVALTDSEEFGEPFFDQQGEATKAITEFFGFLNTRVDSAIQTAAICAELTTLDLIEPWPTTFNDGGKEKNVEGLFRIKEESLNSLPPERLAELRDSGALVLAYCQLLSMQNLEKVKSSQQRQEKVMSNLDDLNFDGFAEEGSISFDNF